MSSNTQTFIGAIKTNILKKLISIGSSLKICSVTEGEAGTYPRLASTMKCDTFVAHAVIVESNKN